MIFLEPVPLGFKAASVPAKTVFSHSADFAGQRLSVVYLVDEAEHARRVSFNIGAITDERSLAAALSLPEDDLAPLETRFDVLLSGPSGMTLADVVDDPAGGRWGRRSLRPVVEPLEIVTATSDWSQGCAVAHDWVGYGPRVVRLDAEAADLPFVLTQASHYGIGVVRSEDGDRVLEPAPFRPGRWSSARWWFAEVIYDQFLDAVHDGLSAV
jgi:hypothetical protein